MKKKEEIGGLLQQAAPTSTLYIERVWREILHCSTCQTIDKERAFGRNLSILEDKDDTPEMCQIHCPHT